MHTPEMIQDEFERIKREDIEEYEAQLAAGLEATDRLEERSKVITRRLHEVTQKHDLDLRELHSVHDDEDDLLAEYLARINPKLNDRPSPYESDLQLKEMYAPALDAAPIERAEPLGSLLLAPDISHFEGMEGERGNPWLSPSGGGTGRIHIGQWYSGSGTGSGCWGVGYIYSPDVAHIYFNYVPSKTGIITVQAWTVLHGYYMARADDGCFTCKMAKAYANMRMDVNQNGKWLTGAEFKICDIDSQNVDTYKIIDEGINLTTTSPVLSNAPVYIRVSVTVGTKAQGSGSYAEVNFKSKAKNGSELNYIWVPCVVVYT